MAFKIRSLLYFCYFILLFSGLFLNYSCGGGNPEGKLLYATHCANCHGDKGEGLEDLNPPLAGSDMLLGAGAGAACWIREGLQGKIVVSGREFEHVMPPQPSLSAVEIANILNYINNAWGNTHDFITLEQVNAALENCK